MVAKASIPMEIHCKIKRVLRVADANTAGCIDVSKTDKTNVIYDIHQIGYKCLVTDFKNRLKKSLCLVFLNEIQESSFVCAVFMSHNQSRTLSFDNR